MNKEIWKELDEYPNFYVSNFGNIRYNNKVVFRSKEYKGNGYPIFFFPRTNNKFPGIRVHKLVAKYFIPNPNKYRYINHKDFNKLNNEATNLEWCTASYNSKHLVEGGRHRGGWSSYTKEQRSGKNNPMFGKRFKCMNNGLHNKYVPLDKINTYLNDGWDFGRIKVKDGEVKPYNG